MSPAWPGPAARTQRRAVRGMRRRRWRFPGGASNQASLGSSFLLSYSERLYGTASRGKTRTAQRHLGVRWVRASGLSSVPVDKTGEIPQAADYFVMAGWRQYRRWDREGACAARWTAQTA